MTAAAWRSIALADARMLFRDPLLPWVVVLPLGLALLLRVLMPAIEAALVQVLFDLSPYHRLIMSGYLMTAPGIIGMVSGFLLLDERDARTLSAVRVTPQASLHRQQRRVAALGPVVALPRRQPQAAQARLDRRRPGRVP